MLVLPGLRNVCIVYIFLSVDCDVSSLMKGFSDSLLVRSVFCELDSCRLYPISNRKQKDIVHKGEEDK